MAESNEQEWTEIGSGYHQLKLQDWKSFVDYIYSDMLDFETYIWRGQRCDTWRLEPTLNRLIREANISSEKVTDFQKNHLEQFQFATRGRRGSNPTPIIEENDWWALGQHHGLATPLLDWTRSPFVAAFFAFSEIGEPQTDHRAIFALHHPTIKDLTKSNQRAERIKRLQQLAEIRADKSRKIGIANLAHTNFLEQYPNPELVLVRPFSDENQRLLNQAGLFTRLFVDKPLENWVTDNHPENDNGITLLKILVPNIDRDVCLRTLNRMNINHLSLFPDLFGTSQYCNLFSEIENY